MRILLWSQVWNQVKKRCIRKKYDVIIIGSGMGGAAAAYSLKDSGASILMIERGGFIPQEKQNWSVDAVVKEK